jgi:hypothetical protein
MTIQEVIKTYLIKTSPSFTHIQLSGLINVTPPTFSEYMNEKAKFPKSRIELLLFKLKPILSLQKHQELEKAFKPYI